MSSVELPEIAKVQPLVMLTGFLGAGKTTLLKELLTDTREEGLRSDVILNDFVDASLDSASLAEYTDQISSLSAGCACCEGLDFLLELSMASAKGSFDLLFIELNGTADPVPIIETYTLLEDKIKLHPRWQICVIDARYFGKRDQYRDIEELQLQTASHIYLTHEEESPPDLITKIQKINAHATFITKEALCHEVIVLGLNEKRRLLKRSETVHPSLKNPEKHQKTHEFNSCQLLMPPNASEERIRLWLQSLPENAIRVKVLMGVTEKPGARFLFERIGLEVAKFPQKVSIGESVPNSAIFIGPALNTQKIKAMTENFFTFSA